MRWFVVLLTVLLSGCTPTGDRQAPDEAATPPPGEPVDTEAAAPELPAVAPAPTMAAFTAEVALACTGANATISGAPLRGDPLAPGAGRRSVDAAVAHFRATSRAWTGAVGRLRDFGLPPHRRAQRLVSALDAVAQYAQMVAGYLDAGEKANAQLALGAMDRAMREADLIARRTRLRRLEDCGEKPRRLPGAARVRVTATDFAFSAEPLRPGPTRLLLRNRGDEDHQLFIVRLRRPGTLGEAVQVDRDGGRPGRFLRGPGAATAVVPPGGRAQLDLRLRRGPYGLLCFVPSPDGTPHAYKGMSTEVVVTR